MFKSVFTILGVILLSGFCVAEEAEPVVDVEDSPRLLEQPTECHCSSKTTLPTPICALYVRHLNETTKIAEKRVYRTKCEYNCDSAFIIKHLIPFACEETSPYPWQTHGEEESNPRERSELYDQETPTEDSMEQVERSKRSDYGIPEWKLPLIKYWQKVHLDEAKAHMAAHLATGHHPNKGIPAWKVPLIQQWIAARGEDAHNEESTNNLRTDEESVKSENPTPLNAWNLPEVKDEIDV